MSASGFPRLALLMMPVIVLGACSESARLDRPESESAFPEEFNAASKRAARALSISQIAGVDPGSAVTAAGEQGPYTWAVLCSAAIDSISDRLRQSSSLDAAQLRLLGQAKGVFDRRIANLSQGASPQEILQTRERDAERTASTDALRALQCLQELQREG